jgi:hypothetical protein
MTVASNAVTMACLQQLDSDVAAPVCWHLEHALVVLQHVVLQEEFEHSRIILVAPDEYLGERTQRFDQHRLVVHVHDL